MFCNLNLNLSIYSIRYRCLCMDALDGASSSIISINCNVIVLLEEDISLYVH